MKLREVGARRTWTYRPFAGGDLRVPLQCEEKRGRCSPNAGGAHRARAMLVECGRCSPNAYVY
eukprot:16014455-Heterocapsa_arctica.AAC.1